VEYEGGSVAGKVMPGPVVCRLRSGGFVVEVGDVTADVVNLPETDVATVVVAMVAPVVGVIIVVVVVVVVVVIIVVVVVVVVIVVVVVVVVIVVVVVVVVVIAVAVAVAVVVAAINDGDGGFASDTLDVAKDFSSIFSELEFSEDDGLDAFEVLEEILSVFSTCVFNVSFLLSILGLSTFFPVKAIAIRASETPWKCDKALVIQFTCGVPRSRSGTKARL